MVECKKTILCMQDCDCKSGSNGHFMAYCRMLDNRAHVDESDKKAHLKFLMGGHRGKTCSSKVAWTTLIKEKSEGRVGLIDPVVQTKALLGKLVVRSLEPPEAPWNILRRQGGS